MGLDTEEQWLAAAEQANISVLTDYIRDVCKELDDVRASNKRLTELLDEAVDMLSARGIN